MSFWGEGACQIYVYTIASMMRTSSDVPLGRKCLCTLLFVDM